MRRAQRGMALLIVLSVIVLLSSLVVAAFAWSRNDRDRAARSIHNLTVQQITESTMQYGRVFYAQHYSSWSTYLNYFLTPRTVARVMSDHPELMAPLASGTGYNCYVYAKDDVDELPPAVNAPGTDNNLRIYVGAYCQETSPPPTRAAITSELLAPLEYNPASQLCQSQFSGGTEGVNNCAVVAGFR